MVSPRNYPLAAEAAKSLKQKASAPGTPFSQSSNKRIGVEYPPSLLPWGSPHRRKSKAKITLVNITLAKLDAD